MLMIIASAFKGFQIYFCNVLIYYVLFIAKFLWNFIYEFVFNTWFCLRAKLYIS